MQYIALTVAILSSVLFTSAAPTTPASNLQRRDCSVAYPQSIGFPINYEIKQDAGGANKRTDAITFTNIPEGSYGCQLEVNFPAGYPIRNSGNSKVYIYAEDGPSKGSQVGTVDFVSSPVAATKYVINSFTCATTMSYQMAIGSDTDAGDVAFADTKDAGITMTYDC